MKKQITILGAGLAGAGLMYLLDPAFGRRRRAIARDKTIHYYRTACRALDITARDLSNRFSALFAKGRRVLDGNDVSDRVLIERVRSELGRLVSHPSSVAAGAYEGQVVLSGPILQHERERLLKGVRNVRGVRSVTDDLVPYEDSGNQPELQGAQRVSRGSILGHWSPTRRAAAVTAGLGTVVWGTRQQNLLRLCGSATGVALITRGLANMKLRHLVRAETGAQPHDSRRRTG